MGAGVVVVFYSLSFIKKEGSEHNMVLLIELGGGGGGSGLPLLSMLISYSCQGRN